MAHNDEFVFLFSNEDDASTALRLLKSFSVDCIHLVSGVAIAKFNNGYVTYETEIENQIDPFACSLEGLIGGMVFGILFPVVPSVIWAIGSIVGALEGLREKENAIFQSKTVDSLANEIEYGTSALIVAITRSRPDIVVRELAKLRPKVLRTSLRLLDEEKFVELLREEELEYLKAKSLLRP